MLSINSQDYRKLCDILNSFVAEAAVESCFIIDRSGQLIVKSSNRELSKDVTFASLIAGNVAASEALSNMLGSRHMKHTFTETEDEVVYMLPLHSDHAMVVVFNKQYSNIGFVKTKIDKYMPAIVEILERAEKRSKEEVLQVVREITADDIRSIFV